jgi:hypothetical protein
VALLEAVAGGREHEAAQLAEALANLVLSAPAIRAALQVRDGGPLAIARAVGLAERVLQPLDREVLAVDLNRRSGRR